MQIHHKFIMLKDQCISITDLRTKTKKCLNSLKGQPKYIFSNNKLVGVLVDPDEYEEVTSLQPLSGPASLIKKIDEEINSHSKSDLIDY